ncbi:hypothetical protein EDB85DRAFT_2246450 [Lactarius pseudohatsudake]|nr:hypothetical protein EDB85DRAFT_2246450 [Lactarius pseudohatsudake]
MPVSHREDIPRMLSATTTTILSTTTNPAGAPASTTPMPPLSTLASSTAAAASTVSSPARMPNVSSAIPVQLPVSSLPTLYALGIVPVPMQSVSVDAPTPAVLRGTSANGVMLNLEINVSLLQPAQMSGLALMLNSIMIGHATS